MSKGLQTDEGRDATAANHVRPTALILNGEFIAAARKLLGHAQSEVRLCAYAWRWYENEPEIGIQLLNLDLYALRRRGVVVRAIVDTLAMRETFRALGFDCISIPSDRTLHTKAIGVDSTGLMIGSHNLTKRGTSDNIEASVLIYDAEPVIAYNEYFDKMWAAYA